MNEERFAEIFVALVKHFTTKHYSYVKYSGKLGTKVNRHIYIYRKMLSLTNVKTDIEARNFFLALFIKFYNQNGVVSAFIGDYFELEHDKLYRQFRLKGETFEYRLRSQLNEFILRYGLRKLKEYEQIEQFGFDVDVQCCIKKTLNLDWQSIDPLESRNIHFLTKYAEFVPKKKDLILKVLGLHK